MSYKIKLLNGVGILWILFFGYRYLVQYLDKSQALWGIGFGLGILFVAWTVDKLEKLRGTVDNIDDRMEEMIKYETD